MHLYTQRAADTIRLLLRQTGISPPTAARLLTAGLVLEKLAN